MDLPPRQSLPEDLVLDAPSLARFLAFCTCTRHPARTTVFQPGDDAGKVIYVVEGQLQVLAKADSGQELVLGQVGEGEFIGEAGLFVSTPARSVWLNTLTACELASIDANRLLDLLRTNLAPIATRLLYMVGAQLSRRLMETARKASGLALMDVSARIWRALDDLTHEPGAMTHPKGIQVKVSRRDLARMVGCSREMAGRIIRQFVEEGRMDAHGKTMVVFR